MAPRLALRLAGPVALTTTNTTVVYTAPSYIPNTLKTVIRWIHISNPTGSTATTFSISIGTGNTAGNRMWDVFPLAAGASFDAFVYIPLTTAETLVAFCSANSTMNITVGGDEGV